MNVAMTVQQKMRLLRILWAAISTTPAVMLLVGYLIIPADSAARDAQPFLLPALSVTAIGFAVASVVVPAAVLRTSLLGLKLSVTDSPSPGPSRGRRRARRFVDSDAARASSLSAAQPSFVMGLAMAESVALVGFVLWFLGFELMMVAPLFGVSWAVLLSKFPRLAQFEAVLERVYDADLT